MCHKDWGELTVFLWEPLITDHAVQPLGLNRGQQKSHLEFVGIPPNKNPAWEWHPNTS